MDDERESRRKAIEDRRRLVMQYLMLIHGADDRRTLEELEAIKKILPLGSNEVFDEQAK